MDTEFVKKYHKIGEVAKMLDVPTSTVRYWEKEFSQVKPMKNKKGDRIFSDIETLKEIKYLVHDRGVKIAKAGRRISGKTEILSENKNSEVVKRLIELKDVLLKIKDNL
jgi:DNA-binding transcriptional MerR regulator